MGNHMNDSGLHTWTQRASERGTILIAVGLAILLLTSFCVFVLDYGIMWLSRRQAQNAADSGALAGAVARAFDEAANPPAAGGVAEVSATKAALANPVFGAAPGVSVSWTCPGFAAGGRCVEVNVFRDGTNGSSVLPVFFAPLLGIASQATRATATAQSQPANASDCLRPLSIPDKWAENRTPPWTYTSTFNRYYTTGPNRGTLISPNPDVYVPPNQSGMTGYTLAVDYGQQMILKGGGNSISHGWYLPVRLPRVDGPSSGGDLFRENLATCTGIVISIGDYVQVESGNMIGPTAQGIAALIAQDPSAYWNATNQIVAGSCAPSCGGFSPRIIALPVFDADIYQRNNATNTWPGCPNGVACLTVRNILGYFVDRMAGSDVIGYLVRYPGVLSSSASSVSEAAAFAQVITLIR